MFPKISVITPCYNAVKTIRRCIDSVSGQNYQGPWEHVIIDGSSTDGTVDVLRTCSHIKWISGKDEGQSDAMNKGFRMSEGSVIVYLNADDEFSAGTFDRVGKIFSMHKGNSLMVVMNLLVRNEDGAEWISRPSIKMKDILHPGLLRYPFNPLSYFYHRGLQESIGSFPLDLHYAMDYWFLLRAYDSARLIQDDHIAGIFHNYQNKTSSREAAEAEVLRVLLHRYKEKFGVLSMIIPNAVRARRILSSFQKK